MGKGGNLRGGMMGRGVAASRTSVFELCTGTRGNSSESSAAPTRRVLRWVLFVLLVDGYVGVKLCVFDLSAHPRNATPIAIAVGLTTICVNVEAWLLANVVQLRTRLLASVAPGLHKHALEYSMATNNWCEVVPAGRGGRGGRGRGRRAPEPSQASQAEAQIGSWEILRHVGALMAPDWWLVLTALVCVVGSGGAALALPSYQGEIIDAVYARQRAKFQNRLLLYLVFSVGTAVSQALRALCFQDVNQMTQPLTTLVGTLTSAMISLVGGVAMAFYTSWRLSMLAFTTVGPIMHVTQAYAQWSREQNRKILAHLGEANAAATEALANVRTVKAMATDELEQRRYEGHTCAARDRGVVDASLSATTQLVNNLYFNKIQSSYNQLISLLSSFTRASGAAQRVLGLLQSMPEKGRGGDDSGEVAGRVRYAGVFFAYDARPNRNVLGGFDLDVAAGSTLALVGKSGSGKTTALHLLLRFYDPARGDVLLDGRPLRSLDVAFLRRHFAIVAQETQLFNTTIYGNIAYGVDGADPAAVAAAAEAALADEFIRDFPAGYDTHVGERGVRISGGQKQRISIARAFLRNPKLLLLDEATSALDAESEAKVQRSLDTLIAGKSATVILVAHRLSTVRNADAIAVVGDGRVLELGDHDALVARKGIYATLVSRQLQVSANTIDETKVDAAAAAHALDIDELIRQAQEAQDALVAAPGRS
ncbi:ATPase [Aureococcus anophagefferens]|nr:ATPase [Aureococcus anophagefferens]